MRPRMARAAILALALLAGAAALGLAVNSTPDGGLERRWLSDTGVPVSGNHHGVAAGRVDGEGFVFAPISGEHGTAQCRMVALAAADGSPRWDHPVPPDACSIHSVATLTLADYDADGTPEVIVPTTEERLYAFAPAEGTRELAFELSSYGYGRAAVGPVAGDGGRAIAVVDASGTVFVVRRDGTASWSHRGESYVWASPAVADLTGDGGPELVVGFGDGRVTAFRRGGGVAWNRSLPGDGSLTWMSVVGSGEGEGTGAGEGAGAGSNGGGDTEATVFAATEAGRLYALDGADGRVRWRNDLGRLAAVGAVADGDGDGELEVYATARDAVLRAFDAETGRTEWETTLTEADVQMTPPPAAGDVDGDGDPELVAVTGDGRVAVVDPVDGTILSTYARSRPFWEGGGPVPTWVDATLADTDGDGTDEIYVMYGDGRVLALEYAES